MKPDIPLHLPKHSSSNEKSYVSELANQFHFEIQFSQPETLMFLSWNGEKIVLCKQNTSATVCADFLESSLNYRRQHKGSELIAKAVNIKDYKTIWDSTAGLGKDAFVLAMLGTQVQLFERHPVAAILLQDAFYRAKNSSETEHIIERMTLNFGSIQDISKNNIKTKPQVILVDPMFPERNKSAAVKKEMTYFQQVIGNDDDSLALLNTARNLATNRIVVKRSRYSDYLTQEKPAYQYLGKSTRFDVYLPILSFGL